MDTEQIVPDDEEPKKSNGEAEANGSQKDSSNPERGGDELVPAEKNPKGDEAKSTGEGETDGSKEASSNSEKAPQEKGDKGTETDSDDEGRPQIFLRDFSEITERDSDDEDDRASFCLPDSMQDKTIFLDIEDDSSGSFPIVPTSVITTTIIAQPQPPKVTLLDQVTYDLHKADVELGAAEDVSLVSNEQTNKNKRGKIASLRKAGGKLDKWLRRFKTGPVQKTADPPMLVPLNGPAARTPSFGSTPAVLQGRTGMPMASSVTNAPISMSPINFNLPGSVSGSLTRPTIVSSAPLLNHGKTNTITLTPVHRPGVNNPQVNVNQAPQIAQIIYDPATGVILYPANSTVITSPSNTPIHQPRLLSHPFRLQNGMVIRPESLPYMQRPGMELNIISTANAPRMSVPPPTPVVMQRAPSPLRTSLNIRQVPPPVSYRQVAPTMRTMPMPLPSVRQATMSTLRQPMPMRQNVPGARLPLPISAISQMALQPRHPVAPQIVRQYGNTRPARPRVEVIQSQPRSASPVQNRMPVTTLSTNVARLPVVITPVAGSGVNTVPKVNGLPPVKTITTPNSVPKAGVIDKSITAGNQKPIPGTVVEGETELHNKTFPSLVVNVKTCLSAKPSRQVQSKARLDLDASVKGVLVHTPAKFTEWLMRRGILKLDHFCEPHGRQPFKLGMYSDTNRQPFSGGYVWTSECCPEKQISVFSGSIFEGSKYPPGTVLKLIYHWSCQTPANNILQWVKVSSIFLKNFFTLLRAVAISWLHEHCPPMGGEMRYVEIGVITLGSSAETSRGVKNVNVEILGVFDPITKIVRMKVINSLQAQLFKDKGKTAQPDANEQGARAFQILWPLTHWVDKRSILLVDGIIDRALFHELGFKNVQQCGDQKAPNAANNMNIMNYLRNLVPKMFSSTLSVLSKSIVQQFLDELSWREMYAATVLLCYENMQDHIASMTKWDLGGEMLISRLNKINQNPFMDWSFTKQTRRCPLNTIPLSLRNEPGIRECIRLVMRDDNKPKPSNSGTGQVAAPAASISMIPTAPKQPRKRERKAMEEPPQQSNQIFYRSHYSESVIKQIPLQNHYYGQIAGQTDDCDIESIFPNNLKCPLCVRIFSTPSEIMRHMYAHVGSVLFKGSESLICNLCMKEPPTGVSMTQHIAQVHKLSDYQNSCRICQEKFRNEPDFVIHMWDLHNEHEAPYTCGICKFSSSFHHQVVQHFQEKHGREGSVVCPFCLKVFPALSLTNLKIIISHLQSHNSRRAKKCPRCVLVFASESDLETHTRDHLSQKSNPSWVEYALLPGEEVILMAIPPQTKTPFQLLVTETPAPPPKKPKLHAPPKKKAGTTTLNATMAIPIDPNERYGGIRYSLNMPFLPPGTAHCVECCEDVSRPGHYIGRLSCFKCRFVTSCEKAMDLHHEQSHSSSAKHIKPVMKTSPVKKLTEPLTCKCGSSSRDPFSLATHLGKCDKTTVYPKSRQTTRITSPTSVAENINEAPPNLSIQQPIPTPASESVPHVGAPPSPKSSIGMLNNAPVTTFEDMLTLEESMASTFESLALPPLLSPTAPLLTLPSLDPSTTTNGISGPPLLANSVTTPDGTSSNWEPDWDMPGFMSKCEP